MRQLTAVPLFVIAIAAACTSDTVSPPTRTLDTGAQPGLDDPSWSVPVNIGAPPNAPFSEFDPFITRNGLSLYFVTGMGRPGIGMRDIWVSERATPGDPWGEPRNLGLTVNSAVHEQHPAISVDGHYLYFSSNRTALGDFDLFVSRREDTGDNLGWGPPVNLGSAVNSAADETGMSIAVGELYFSSSRLGGMDIYAAQARSGADFGEATIVESLSTPFQDIDPALSRDGQEIFIGSDRPGTLGNIDVWRATRDGRAHGWSVPTNLGPAINTAFFDGGTAPSFDGRDLYFQSAFRMGNVGGPMFDIWVTRRASHPGPNEPALTVADARSSGASSPAVGSRHIIVFANESVPHDFDARVREVGATVESTLGELGVAIVSGLSGAGAAALGAAGDVRDVEADVMFGPGASAGEADADAADPLIDVLPSADALPSPAAAQFHARQWNLRAVHAPEAWAAGHLGSRDVVVAILDSGIDYLHPDLVGLVDLGRSKSFVPEDDGIIAQRFPGRLPFSDLNNHGTSVASVVASNATALAGVNREVTLLAVKIWDRSATGPFGRMLAGIVYAADQGADVINISGSSSFAAGANPGIRAAANRAANYAFRKGTLIVSVAMNDAADLDHNGDVARLPCESPHVICTSATAPTAAAGVNGPWTDADATVPYTAFGRSAVDVAAPGGFGDVANPNPQIGQFRRIWAPCTTTVIETSAQACVRGMALAQPFGTSYAAPHVAGLAALLVAKHGHGQPALIRSRILESADDLGAPGVDPFYGHGRINIARALGVLP